jgi:transcription antitermination factor NusG
MFDWYALYVKSRHEFATGRELERKGIVTYVPAVKRWSQWKDRRKLIDTPLFPGYLFVCVEPYPEYFINVLKTAGAVCLVCAEPGRPTPVPEDEILSLRLLVESGRDLDIYPSLKEGAQVRIRRGPLKGAEGILKHKEESSIFLVTISLLGRTVGVRIYAEDLEAA